MSRSTSRFGSFEIWSTLTLLASGVVFRLGLRQVAVMRDRDGAIWRLWGRRYDQFKNFTLESLID